jgi:hypothetical protein
MMVAQYLRAQAWWRLDSPGLSAVRVARSVVALLDAAACLAYVPENHPDLEELDRAGCFATGIFDPGGAGLAMVRGWELTGQPTSTERDLLGALAVTVSCARGLPSPANPGNPAPFGRCSSQGTEPGIAAISGAAARACAEPRYSPPLDPY